MYRYIMILFIHREVNAYVHDTNTHTNTHTIIIISMTLT